MICNRITDKRGKIEQQHYYQINQKQRDQCRRETDLPYEFEKSSRFTFLLSYQIYSEPCVRRTA